MWLKHISLTYIYIYIFVLRLKVRSFAVFSVMRSFGATTRELVATQSLNPQSRPNPSTGRKVSDGQKAAQRAWR